MFEFTQKVMVCCGVTYQRIYRLIKQTIQPPTFIAFTLNGVEVKRLSLISKKLKIRLKCIMYQSSLEAIDVTQMKRKSSLKNYITSSAFKNLMKLLHE